MAQAEQETVPVGPEDLIGLRRELTEVVELFGGGYILPIDCDRASDILKKLFQMRLDSPALSETTVLIYYLRDQIKDTKWRMAYFRSKCLDEGEEPFRLKSDLWERLNDILDTLVQIVEKVGEKGVVLTFVD